MRTWLPVLFMALALAGQCGCQIAQRRAPTIQSTAVSETLTNAFRTASGGSYSVPEPLVSLNKLFLAGYTNRQASIKTNTSPLIVANFSTLIFRHNGFVETNRSIPDIYHSLKAVAHVPFGIFLRVDPIASEAGSDLPKNLAADLGEYQKRIQEAEASITQAGFSEEQLMRQQTIFRICNAYLDELLSSGKASRERLRAFTRDAGPLMLANADDAARAQLDMTHAAVMQWKKRTPPEEWKRLVVVVRGFQMARRLNILTQYFAKVIDEPSHSLGYPLESKRLIYAEFIMRDRDHLDLMATTFIDGDASDAFFGDRWRMSRDVLADGAENHLRQLKFE
jgi:hypothetical protein